MKADNRGITFVEMVLVVALMSLIIGITGYGISMISGKPAEECAQKIKYSLESTRTKAMGKYSTTYELYRDSATEMVMVKESVVVSAGAEPIDTVTTVGERTVTVEYMLADTTVHTLGVGDSIIFSFNRVTGGFEPVSPWGLDCEEIKVSKASKTRTITLVPPTGRVSID